MDQFLLFKKRLLHILGTRRMSPAAPSPSPSVFRRIKSLNLPLGGSETQRVFGRDPLALKPEDPRPGKHRAVSRRGGCAGCEASPERVSCSLMI